MKFENTKVFGYENAILGARLPMCTSLQEAKEKSDSGWYFENGIKDGFTIGEKDLDLLTRLINADNKDGASGQPNSKFLRMIHVQVCITAPDYLFRELDTYKLGTVRNSSSQMHKLASTPITMDCFEMDDFEDFNFSDTWKMKEIWETNIKDMEYLRLKFNATKEKKYWKALVRMLPQSWLYTAMFDCNYATLRNICSWRGNHKLNEWSGKDKKGVENFIDWARTLPYAEQLIFNDGDK